MQLLGLHERERRGNQKKSKRSPKRSGGRFWRHFQRKTQVIVPPSNVMPRWQFSDVTLFKGHHFIQVPSLYPGDITLPFNVNKLNRRCDGMHARQVDLCGHHSNSGDRHLMLACSKNPVVHMSSSAIECFWCLVAQVTFLRGQWCHHAHEPHCYFKPHANDTSCDWVKPINSEEYLCHQHRYLFQNYRQKLYYHAIKKTTCDSSL